MDQFNYENYKIVVTSNRELSFTNSKDAYFYTTTHLNKNDNWFSGWNIAGIRIFNDYTLYIDSQPLKKSKSKVIAYPDKFYRYYDNNKAIEIFSMIDSISLLYFEISVVQGRKIGFSVDTNLTKFTGTNGNISILKVNENNEYNIYITPLIDGDIAIANNIIVTDKKNKGFIVICAKSIQQAYDIIKDFRLNKERYLTSRKKRIENVLKNSFILSSDMNLNVALPWISATLDQLITKQQGYGIYAGLPWFNQYWGRDMFISFPGACLVSGKTNIAKQILLDFAKFQNLDSTSKYYGRIPNRAQPTDIIYNTADGTPRFVISIYEYILYTKDFSILEQLYPNIKISVEGNLKYWVDNNGFLLHDDADTWMDAKKDGKIPFSPRGIAANDIQYLWYKQLQITEYFAAKLNDTNFAKICKNYSTKLKNNFSKFFCNDKYGYLADRLDSNYIQDWKFRPNQLFAFELLEDTLLKANITKLCWEKLTYPWGVASLSQDDDDFHPWHHCDLYFFDEAYHNGIVWLWLNGIMMQRMIEFGQYNKAYELFDNMSKQALFQGAIGSLPENADALPRNGKKWADRSGAFLQAWSNAEYLRIWYQYFLGVQPDLINNIITIKPSIPDKIEQLFTQTSFEDSKIKIFAEKINNKRVLTYIYNGPSRFLAIELPFFEKFKYEAKNNDKIEIIIERNVAHFTIENKDGNIKFDLNKIPKYIEYENKINKIFEKVDFCKPLLRKDLKIFKNK